MLLNVYSPSRRETGVMILFPTLPPPIDSRSVPKSIKFITTRSTRGAHIPSLVYVCVFVAKNKIEETENDRFAQLHL